MSAFSAKETDRKAALPSLRTTGNHFHRKIIRVCSCPHWLRQQTSGAVANDKVLFHQEVSGYDRSIVLGISRTELQRQRILGAIGLATRRIRHWPQIAEDPFLPSNK